MREVPNYHAEILRRALLRARDTSQQHHPVAIGHGQFDLGGAATGHPAERQSVIIWRIACGHLLEHWVTSDHLTEYQ